jgi:hypothetical protein
LAYLFFFLTLGVLLFDDVGDVDCDDDDGISAFNGENGRRRWSTPTGMFPKDDT